MECAPIQRLYTNEKKYKSSVIKIFKKMRYWHNNFQKYQGSFESLECI